MAVHRSVHDREDRILAELCEQLADGEGCEVKVIERPDRKTTSKSAPDAVILRGEVRWAVDHTRVFERPEMLRLRKRLELVRDEIVDRLAGAFPDGLLIVAIALEELQVGNDWKLDAKAIGDAALNTARTLKDREARWLGTKVRSCVQLVAREVRQPGCYVHPLAPEDMKAQRTQVIRAALDSKRVRMLAAKTAGYPTLLILDAVEYLWHSHLYEAFEAAAMSDTVAPFDEIYLAVAGDTPAHFVPLKLGDRWPVGQPDYGKSVDLWVRARDRRLGTVPP
jgi:hypothetical protein